MIRTALSMMLVAMLATPVLAQFPIVIVQPVDDGSTTDANGWFRSDGGTAHDMHQDTTHTPPGSFTASGRNGTNAVQGNEIGAISRVVTDLSGATNVPYLNFDIPTFDPNLVTEVRLQMHTSDCCGAADVGEHYKVGWSTGGALTAPEMSWEGLGGSFDTTLLTIDLTGAAWDPDLGDAVASIDKSATPFTYVDAYSDDAGLAEHIVANMGGKVTLFLSTVGTDNSHMVIHSTDPCLEDNCAGPSEAWPADNDAPGTPADPQFAPTLVIVPEPASMALIGIGGLMMLRRRR